MNKLPIFICLTFSCFFLGAQSRGNNSAELVAISKKYYLDCIEVDIDKIYLNSDNIRSITKQKGLAVTYIFSKGKVEFFSLTELSNQKVLRKDSLPMAFIIDGVLIKDTTAIKIDPSIMKDVQVLNTANSSIFHGTAKTIILVSTKFNRKKFKKRL